MADSLNRLVLSPVAFHPDPAVPVPHPMPGHPNHGWPGLNHPIARHPHPRALPTPIPRYPSIARSGSCRNNFHRRGRRRLGDHNGRRRRWCRHGHRRGRGWRCHDNRRRWGRRGRSRLSLVHRVAYQPPGECPGRGADAQSFQTAARLVADNGPAQRTQPRAKDRASLRVRAGTFATAQQSQNKTAGAQKSTWFHKPRHGFHIVPA